MADLGGFGAGLESEGGKGSSPRWLWWVEGGEGERWRGEGGGKSPRALETIPPARSQNTS